MGLTSEPCSYLSEPGRAHGAGEGEQGGPLFMASKPSPGGVEGLAGVLLVA